MLSVQLELGIWPGTQACFVGGFQGQHLSGNDRQGDSVMRVTCAKPSRSLLVLDTCGEKPRAWPCA